MGRTPKGQTREQVYTFVRERLLAGDPPTVRDVREALGFRAVQTAREHLEALVAEGRLVAARGRSRGYRLPVGEGEAAAVEGVAELELGEGLESGGSGGVGAGRRAGVGREVEAAAAGKQERDRGVGALRLVTAVPVSGGARNGALEERVGAVAVPVLGRVAAGVLTAAVEDLEGYIPVEPRGSGEELFALRVQGESMIGAGILPGDLAIVRRQPRAESGQIVVALVGDEATVKRLQIRERRIELHPANLAFEPIVPDPDDVVILGRVIEVRRVLD